MVKKYLRVVNYTCNIVIMITGITMVKMLLIPLSNRVILKGQIQICKIHRSFKVTVRPLIGVYFRSVNNS
jgi:hypothetical protein